jgi:hypothetical protein
MRLTNILITHQRNCHKQDGQPIAFKQVDGYGNQQHDRANDCMKGVLLVDLRDKNVGYKRTNELLTRLINIKDLANNKQPQHAQTNDCTDFKPARCPCLEGCRVHLMI